MNFAQPGITVHEAERVENDDPDYVAKIEKCLEKYKKDEFISVEKRI